MPYYTCITKNIPTGVREEIKRSERVLVTSEVLESVRRTATLARMYTGSGSYQSWREFCGTLPRRDVSGRGINDI